MSAKISIPKTDLNRRDFLVSTAAAGGAMVLGFYLPSTSAQAAAAFARLLAAGTVRSEQTTVLVLTGSGLKATPRIAELLGIAL